MEWLAGAAAGTEVGAFVCEIAVLVLDCGCRDHGREDLERILCRLSFIVVDIFSQMLVSTAAQCEDTCFGAET